MGKKISTEKCLQFLPILMRFKFHKVVRQHFDGDAENITCGCWKFSSLSNVGRISKNLLIYILQSYRTVGRVVHFWTQCSSSGKCTVR
jgi:hypothetical protein